MKVIVVGGGVAGITAAFAIHNRLGWEVVIYEGLNSENFEEREGVGFVITPAGIDVLRAIGIHSELPSERMHSINVMDPNEQPVFTKQFGEEDTHLVVLRKVQTSHITHITHNTYVLFSIIFLEFSQNTHGAPPTKHAAQRMQRGECDLQSPPQCSCCG